MKLNGRFNADLCVRKIYGEPSLYVSIHISFFYFVCITTLCFTKSLEVDDFSCAEEFDGVCDLGNIPYYTEDVVISGAGFLLCCHIFKQIGDRISLHLEFTSVEGDSGRSLRPYTDSMIYIVRTKTGLLDLFHGQIAGKLVYDRSNHFHVCQFVGTYRIDMTEAAFRAIWDITAI